MATATDSLLRPHRLGHWRPDDFPPEAVGFRLVRIIQPGDRLRLYEGFRWRDRAAMAQFLNQRMLGAEGYANADYALADVLDADHDIVAEFGIATRHAFRRLQYKLRAPVDSTDGDEKPSSQAKEGRR